MGNVLAMYGHLQHLSLVQTGDKKACQVAVFIQFPLLSRRQERRMNENRYVTSFLVTSVNQALWASIMNTGLRTCLTTSLYGGGRCCIIVRSI